MFKKSLVSLALSSLMISGLAVSEASAVTPYVDSSNAAAIGTTYTVSSASSSSVVVPDQV